MHLGLANRLAAIGYLCFSLCISSGWILDTEAGVCRSGRSVAARNTIRMAALMQAILVVPWPKLRLIVSYRRRAAYSAQWAKHGARRCCGSSSTQTSPGRLRTRHTQASAALLGSMSLAARPDRSKSDAACALGSHGRLASWYGRNCTECAPSSRQHRLVHDVASMRLHVLAACPPLDLTNLHCGTTASGCTSFSTLKHPRV